MSAVASDAERWLNAELLRQALIDAAVALAPEGIELMAVKGTYLVYALGVDATARTMLDADAVVVRGSFGLAVRTLSSSGEWTAHEGWSSKVLARTAPRRGVIDLHRTALPPFFGRMRSSTLRRRGRRHPAFEGRLLVPEPYDAACLAIAHYVKDCLGAKGHGGLARDLEWIAERGGIDPTGLAARLSEHGLRRVGLVAFAALGEGRRWAPWLDALSPTRVERVAIPAVVAAIRLAAPQHYSFAFLLARTLGDDVGTSACGFAATAARLMRDRIQRPWRRFSTT